MSRQCMITGTKPLSGNNVSHANNKTRRRFLPNVKEARLYSETLKRFVKLRASANGLRTVEHNGGLDNFLTETPVSRLQPGLRPIRDEILVARQKEVQDAKAGTSK